VIVASAAPGSWAPPKENKARGESPCAENRAQESPNPSGPLGQIATIEIRLPLHPTGTVLGDGRRVWETAAEVEPKVLYELMLRRPLALGVPAVLDPVQVNSILESPYTPRHDPHTSNWHYVKVQNPNLLEGDGGWQRLRIP
jgi:hypothetical protein